MIQDGIDNLTKALEIDPQYDDAMAYMFLLIRDQADLRDAVVDYETDIVAANTWLQKALETKKSKAGGNILRQFEFPWALPPPPPAPSGASGSNASDSQPQRIRVSRSVQEQNLFRKVEPVYPPLARQARVQGTVRFTAIIGKDGTIQNVQLVSGHPLLVAAAQEAVRQWEYRPTLLNGQPVEVVTSIDVNFTLTQ